MLQMEYMIWMLMKERWNYKPNVPFPSMLEESFRHQTRSRETTETATQVQPQFSHHSSQTEAHHSERSKDEEAQTGIPIDLVEKLQERYRRLEEQLEAAGEKKAREPAHEERKEDSGVGNNVQGRVEHAGKKRKALEKARERIMKDQGAEPPDEVAKHKSKSHRCEEQQRSVPKLCPIVWLDMRKLSNKLGDIG